MSPHRDDDREARSNRCPHASENRFAGPLFLGEELVERMDFHANLFPRLERPDRELTMSGRIEHSAEVRSSVDEPSPSCMKPVLADSFSVLGRAPGDPRW